ncbi:MAG: FAD-binding oxidoreductase, partial [Desulfobacterales bacterium]
PGYLESGLRRIQQSFLADTAGRGIIDRRPYIAGGYNLKALVRCTDMAQLAAHLLVGSVGTLGIVTEIRLKLLPQQPSMGTFVAHFRDYDEFAEAAIRLKTLDPAALEFSDAACAGFVNGQILNLQDPSIVGTVVAEFDASAEQARAGREIVGACDVSRIWDIGSGSPEESALWQDRRRIQPSLMKYGRENKLLFPSIIDDVAIHLEDFGRVIPELQGLMQELGVEICFYGHLGFGSIHARPFFDATAENLAEQIETVSKESFKVLQKYNGTLVGEHNAGRSRSIYLEMELGSAFRYMREIKNLFDPDDILNPGVLFDTGPISMHMDFTVR